MNPRKRYFVAFLLLLLFLPTISPTLCFSQPSAEGSFYDAEQAALHGDATDLTARTSEDRVMVAAAAVGEAGAKAGKTVRERINAGSVVEWAAIIASVTGVVLLTLGGGDTTTTSNH